MGTKNKSQNCVHILNGDALLEQFPRDLKGASIVFRECLVDGPVTGNSLKELYQKRSAFFAQTYQVCTPIEYEERIVSEFKKVQKIPNGSEINLWFEDDLFCQVNCWFVCYLLRDIKDCDLYLVRPNNQSPYAFSFYTETELTELYLQRQVLLAPFLLAPLWQAYATGAVKQLTLLSQQLPSGYLHVKKAVSAHLSRIPKENKLGKPIEVLKKIIENNDTESTELIYQEFQKQLPIYGFGDLQIKHLLMKFLSKK